MQLYPHNKALLNSKLRHIYSRLHMGQSIQNGPSKICGRQPLKNLMGYDLLKAVFHKFYLVHSWILCPIYCTNPHDNLNCHNMNQHSWSTAPLQPAFTSSWSNRTTNYSVQPRKAVLVSTPQTWTAHSTNTYKFISF